MLERERLTHHAAHRQAYQWALAIARDARALPSDIRRHILERVGALGHGILPWPRRSKASTRERWAEDGNEVLPHSMVATDGVREDDDLAAAPGVDAVKIERLHRFGLRGVFLGAPAADARPAITSRASRKAVLADGMPQ